MVKPMLTTPQAAAMLGVSAATLRTWRARGQGPKYKQPAGPGSSAAYAPEVIELFKMERERSIKTKRTVASAAQT